MRDDPALDFHLVISVPLLLPRILLALLCPGFEVKDFFFSSQPKAWSMAFYGTWPRTFQRILLIGIDVVL